jgi:hypothetical protein
MAVRPTGRRCTARLPACGCGGGDPCPLVPLGTHTVLETVNQHKIVTAIRACKVAADPTNALALEAAVRRMSPAHGKVRLAATQRVVRA